MKWGFFLFFFLLLKFLYGQETRWQHYKQLSSPEKFWVITHPFVALKAQRLTQEAISITDKAALKQVIGADFAGGRLDAFRHALWMALLVQHIAPRKAFRLGKAHEKGNFRDYKKRKTEEGIIPDKASSEMDLWNNNIGICIGITLKPANSETLEKAVIAALLKGELRIIKKDIHGNFLDKDNSIIPQEKLTGKWENNKVLVPSNTEIKFFQE